MGRVVTSELRDSALVRLAESVSAHRRAKEAVKTCDRLIDRLIVALRGRNVTASDLARVAAGVLDVPLSPDSRRRLADAIRQRRAAARRRVTHPGQTTRSFRRRRGSAQPELRRLTELLKERAAAKMEARRASSELRQVVAEAQRAGLTYAAMAASLMAGSPADARREAARLRQLASRGRRHAAQGP
jgi:hypothetical protein